MFVISLGSSKCVAVVRACKNPVMTLPVKKRINTELFIDRTTALYILVSRIKDEINKRDEPVALADCRV